MSGEQRLRIWYGAADRVRDGGPSGFRRARRIATVVDIAAVSRARRSGDLKAWRIIGDPLAGHRYFETVREGTSVDGAGDWPTRGSSQSPRWVPGSPILSDRGTARTRRSASGRGRTPVRSRFR